MAESDLNTISDGGELRALQGGLVIIRRMKHEWRDELDGMILDKLRARTGKKWGSKFLATWALPHHVDWVAAQVAKAGWQRQSHPFQPLDVRLERPIGLAEGENVHTIRIVCDGHYVHAYPIKD